MEQVDSTRRRTSFDRVVGSLEGLPDVAKTKATTLVTTEPLVGDTQTFVIQTYRQREVGDFVLMQYIDAAGHMRIVIPPAVADAIARQREALTSKVRRRIAKDQAAARKAAGIQPGFMQDKKRRTS